MPRETHACPFCPRKYKNEARLRCHLSSYTGEWRVRADGKHDVLQINEILDPEANDDSPYRCPSCPNIILGRRRFLDHIHASAHAKFIPRPPDWDRLRGTWDLLIAEETVKIRPTEMPFLRFPYDIRVIIYHFILVHDTIVFRDETGEDTPRWQLRFQRQYNPRRNPLALLIASRQVYEEARRVFYPYNTFVFYYSNYVPIFLVGIGCHNARLLRTLRWYVGPERQNKNQKEMMRRWLEAPSAKNIWNNKQAYLELHKAVETWTSWRRDGKVVRRWDAGDLRLWLSCWRGRRRFTMQVKFWNQNLMTPGRVSFELRTKYKWSYVGV
ncbi:hypothetical protein BO78DRAFT_418620 [Aspergillus sclerotiicarbonarius CBS 121057]|uniref:C2H2-type domain-containing protein n=1 Tax=Aspergillus sclerotiicarbonarius (strain CBS 121057 / IBT 28362) TaxID=1448318 RepID=A0A319E8I3_ASPSB|nr:hypothetical protein BO78DRAFT_418620 [Aspergillus sclerotiicarbonarius CBS 121057]